MSAQRAPARRRPRPRRLRIIAACPEGPLTDVPDSSTSMPGTLSVHRRKLPRALRATLWVGILAAVTGCASQDRSRSGLFQPYRIEIPQGNYVDQSMFRQVKPGMTREQVRFALGTPLLTDPFRNDRWDYFYMMHKAGELTEQRVVTIVFSGNELLRIEGDVVAGGTALPADAKPAAPAAAAPEKK